MDSLEDFAPRKRTTPQNSLDEDAAPPPSREQLSRLAKSEGFTISNFDEKPVAALRGGQPQTFSKTIRIRVRDWNRFQTWCNEHGHTQWKGFEMLVSKLDENT